MRMTLADQGIAMRTVAALAMCAGVWLLAGSHVHAVSASAGKSPAPAELAAVTVDPATTAAPPAATRSAKTTAAPASKAAATTARPARPVRPERPATAAAAKRSPPLKIDLKKAAREASAAPSIASRAVASRPPATVSAPLAAEPDLPDHLRRNLYGPASVQGIEMGDRPRPGTSLCGDGSKRRFAEIDQKTAAAMLPELPAMRPRTICARRGTVIADYMFR